MKMLFVSPKGVGGIFSQTQLLVSELNIQKQVASLFISTKARGALTALSIFRIFYFAAHLIKHSPDIVIFELASKGSTYRKIAYAAVCNLLKVPYIIHLHGGGYEDFYFGSEKFMKRKIDKFFSKSAGIALLHDGQIPLVRKILDNSPKTRMQVLPNGVQTLDKNLYVAPLSSEPLRLVFLGNVSQEKGIPELLKAMATFSRDEVHLHLVGHVELNESEKLELSQAETRGTVTSVGAKNKDEALSILAKSHLLILPSKVENFPNVILEAYSLGVPVIATPVGGITKLVLEGHTGWLLNPHDQLEIEIAQKIRHVRRSLSSIPLISKRVFELSHSTYDIKITAGLLKNFCIQALDAQPRSPEAAGNN